MTDIRFEPLGIGEALRLYRFTVPMNQREFAWEEEHVTDLLHDFAKAIEGDNPTYFLGTIVLTGDEQREVSDGQQRLTTVTILLAAIRDYLIKIGDVDRVESIEPVYLRERDLETSQVLPKLRLNVTDNEFFTNYVLARPGAPERSIQPSLGSHKLIKQAAELARRHVESIVAPFRPQDQAIQLVRWVKFLKDGVLIILARVPDHLNAFVMFETLNDRGLRASQADLLKNYLLSRAGDRVDEAQQRWARMLGVLDSIGIPNIAVTYLRHVVILREGPTKDRDLYAKVESAVTSQAKAITFLDTLADSAPLYAAVLNPSHSLWNDFPSNCARYADTMLELQLQQIRPLVFAIVREFPKDQVEGALRLCVAWSVRFLIAGGGGGGTLDRHYGIAAQQVGLRKIRTAKTLAASMSVVPSDAAFEAAFADARVSQAGLAKYYLRALELHVKGDTEPELVPNSDGKVLNLEHVLPENPNSNWPELIPEVAEAHYRRLGNMVLLQAKKNSQIGNKSFAEKRPVLAASSLVLTSQVGKKKKWGVVEISARQRELAKLAVKTWRLSVS